MARRYKHSLSNYRLATANLGALIPVQNIEILPGDSIRAASSALIRLTPQIAPVMHPITVRMHHFFVPKRLLWNKYEGETAYDWEDFITGGKDGNATPEPPLCNRATMQRTEGDLLDHLGVPPVNNITVTAFAKRAYFLIWNEFYRDQDLRDERDIYNEDDNTIQEIAWEKDYFTAARPWPQKGDDVTVPLGGLAPITGLGTQTATFNDQNVSSFETDGTIHTYPFGSTVDNTAADGLVVKGTAAFGSPEIYANLDETSGTSVNAFRRAFAIQRYQEARAMYGSRYTEYLSYLGVNPADSRLQRPEYLGGGKATVNFSEVLQTSETNTEGTPLGTLGGHGIAAVRTRPFTRHFNEHGIFMTLLSTRPKAIYADGIHRSYLKRQKEDYWQRELEMIGNQQVINSEVYAAQDGEGNDTFGYSDRYAEYKSHPSQIAGEFRTIMNHWHLARQFESRPALNDAFINCNPSKRIFAEQNQDSLWIMVQNQVRARRLVKRSVANRIL